MVIIPQRLFDDPRVQVIMQDGHTCILKKTITDPLVNREGYISNHVVSIVLQGRQQIKTYEEEVIEVTGPAILFIPRGLYYVSDLLPHHASFTALLFYFNDQAIQSFLAEAKVSTFERHDAPSYLKIPFTNQIQHFTDALMKMYGSKKKTPKPILHLKILELLHLLNQSDESKNFANFLFRLTLPERRNIKTFMEKNYDKPLKIEDYAYLTGRSASSFRRDFKAQFKIAPQQWIKDKRLEKAVTLFNDAEISVTNAAFEVGYENVSYFIKAFKQKMGISPKQYLLSIHRNYLDH